MPGLEFIEALFHGVCSQWADHTWSLDGIPLPFCQRCTGLYLGAAAAVMFQLIDARPANSKARWIYGLLLLQMVPFGLHWIPQTAAVRMATGCLFSFGGIGLLWRVVTDRWPALRPTLAEHRNRTVVILAGGMLGNALLAFQSPALAVSILGTVGLLTIALLSTLALALAYHPRPRRPLCSATDGLP